MPILLNKTLRLFLDSIGRREEYEYYLKRFQAPHEGSFALVFPEREGLEDAAPVLAFDLDFLVKVGLDPLIVLAGPEAEEMAALLAEPTGRISVMTHAAGAPALPEGVADHLTRSRLEGRAAVLVCPGLDRREALRALVPAVSRRVHIIRPQGALRDVGGAPLAYLDTARPGRVQLAEEDRDLAGLAGWALDLAPGIHVSVASPLNLLKELFTVKGAGCVVRRGAEIVRIENGAGLDRPRLEALLAESFHRPLRSADCLDRAGVIYLERHYRGAALLEHYPEGAYLSKFAVGKAARGEGLAVELWGELARHVPALFWRARLANPIHQWYERNADGSHRLDPWRIYWRGIAPDRIPGVICVAASRPDDFA